MANGTVIPVYVKHLHKHNAHGVQADAEHMMKIIGHQLLAMAAAGDRNSDIEEPWYEHVAREVPRLLEEYVDEAFKSTMAARLLENPDECDDDLEAV